MSENTYFRKEDDHSREIMGYPIADGWWSRFYEYTWAIQYAEKDHVVADMGAGWQERPFKNALGKACKRVYAVDWGTGLLSQEHLDNVVLVVDGFTHRIKAIKDGELDRVFCISVLEEVGDIQAALNEFYRCLKPCGLCVLTMDVQYDKDRPLGAFGAVDMQVFMKAVIASGFVFRDAIDSSMSNVVFNEAFNLCVFHCVLEKPCE